MMVSPQLQLFVHLHVGLQSLTCGGALVAHETAWLASTGGCGVRQTQAGGNVA